MDKKEYKENHDTLVTFGEEAYTMRKDDPRTKEAIKESKKKKEETLNKALTSGKISMFEGINLSDVREDNESFEDYKARRQMNKNLWKIYNKLGIEECQKQFPMGFKYALINEINSINEKNNKSQMTATITNEDGTVQEAKVIINNDKK
tara:strand:+ start:61 stop:507 length:447 start_codon:yes stop_codon:yes gene_type:complete